MRNNLSNHSTSNVEKEQKVSESEDSSQDGEENHEYIDSSKPKLGLKDLRSNEYTEE